MSGVADPPFETIYMRRARKNCTKNCIDGFRWLGSGQSQGRSQTGVQFFRIGVSASRRSEEIYRTNEIHRRNFSEAPIDRLENSEAKRDFIGPMKSIDAIFRAIFSEAPIDGLENSEAKTDFIGAMNIPKWDINYTKIENYNLIRDS